MILGNLDTGPSYAILTPQNGQTLGTVAILGSRTIVYPQGAIAEKQTVQFWATAWAGLGGQAAGSFLALRYLLRQLEELATLAEPVYLQWTSSAFGGAWSVVDPHDGWYVIEALDPDYTAAIGGNVPVKMTVSAVYVDALPLTIATAFTGAALASTYSATAVPAIGLPLGGGNASGNWVSRTGAEGALSVYTSPSNPMPWMMLGSLATLYQGGCRVFDTINTGSNPIPTSGGFTHANWVEVYGTSHNFVGDCVVTNGLVLHLYATGSAPAPTVYLWNTSLGTPAWQSLGQIQYHDNSGGSGTLRTIDLDRVSQEEVRLRVRLQTSNNWVLLKQKLQRGSYHTYLEYWALTENATSQSNLQWTTTAAYATGFTESTSSTTFPSNLATTSTSGYAGFQASATASPIGGWFYQNTPTTAQGRLVSTTVFALGDSVGPLIGAYKLYGFWAAPTSGAPSVATDRTFVAPLFAQWLYDRSTRWVRG